MVLKVFQVMVILSKEMTRCTGLNNKIDISFMQFFLTFWVQFFGIFYIVLLGLSDPNAITCSPLKYIYFFYIFFYILREEIERMRLKVSFFFFFGVKKRKEKDWVQIILLNSQSQSLKTIKWVYFPILSLSSNYMSHILVHIVSSSFSASSERATVVFHSHVAISIKIRWPVRVIVFLQFKAEGSEKEIQYHWNETQLKKIASFPRFQFSFESKFRYSFSVVVLSFYFFLLSKRKKNGWFHLLPSRLVISSICFL